MDWPTILHRGQRLSANGASVKAASPCRVPSEPPELAGSSHVPPVRLGQALGQRGRSALEELHSPLPQIVRNILGEQYGGFRPRRVENIGKRCVDIRFRT